MTNASPDLPEGIYSREEYYRWCEMQPRGRFERIDGRIVAMRPERMAHLCVKAAMWFLLREAIMAAGVNCQALPSGVAVGDSDFEPDAMVNSGPRSADDAFAAPNPVVIVEVLSPNPAGTITGDADTSVKFVAYFTVPSVVHHLIVHPTNRVVIHHRRRDDGFGIHTRIVNTADIALAPPGITINVERIYTIA
jgi:Uma2 family endonuclease